MPRQSRRVLSHGAAKQESEEPRGAEADGALLALAVADRGDHRADRAGTDRPLVSVSAPAAARRLAALGRGAVRWPLAGQAEIERFEAPELVAQARRLLELEIGGGGAHALVEIGDH